MPRVDESAFARTPSRRQRLATALHRTGLLSGLIRLRSLFVRDLRILAYHRVLTIEDAADFDFDLDLVSASAEQFRKQMSLVRRRFNPIRFSDLFAAIAHDTELPSDPVIVTFDDGYDDNYRVAFPILRELAIPATFFVSTGHVDSGLPYAYDWLVHMICRSESSHLHIAELDIDCPMPVSLEARRKLGAELLDRLKWLDASVQEAIIARLEKAFAMPRAQGHRDCRPMNWDQLREMHAAGMEIGSHGVWHRMLAKLEREDMVAEVISSKTTLDRELGAPVEVISYPVGGSNAYNDDVIEASRQAGFLMGCSYISGTNPIPSSPHFALRRLPIEREMNLAWFAAIVGLPEAFSYPSRERIG